MKRIISVLTGVILLLSVVCACSANKNEDINYVIKLSCDSEKLEWKYEMKSEGIVTVTPSVNNEENGSSSYIFLLESVGEGETEIKFTLTEKESENVAETVIYKISVDSDFVITAEMLSDSKAGETEKVPVSISTKGEAEKLVDKKLLSEDKENEGKLFYETQKDSDGNYLVRVFKAKTDSDGKTVMKYQFTYIVSPDGEMTKITENNITDMIVVSK